MKKNEKYNKNNELNPNFITGFADGEACFSILIQNRPDLKIG